MRMRRRKRWGLSTEPIECDQAWLKSGSAVSGARPDGGCSKSQLSSCMFLLPGVLEEGLPCSSQCRAGVGVACGRRSQVLGLGSEEEEREESRRSETDRLRDRSAPGEPEPWADSDWNLKCRAGNIHGLFPHTPHQHLHTIIYKLINKKAL